MNRRATAKSSALGKNQQKAWGALLLAHASVTRRVNQALESAGSISIELYDVLLALEDAPDRRMRMSELAAQVVFSPSGLTRVVDRLEKLGYVRRERHPNDGRSLFACLTDEGLAARIEAWPIYREALEELWGRHLSDNDAVTVERALQKVFEECPRRPS